MQPSEQLRFRAHELAAMAKTGLEFAPKDYDRDRYERTMAIAEGIAEMTIDATFTPERPYLSDLHIPSPKVGCSVAAFDDVGRVVLIKRADNGRWALPGGYAEVGSPPSTNALRELRQRRALSVLHLLLSRPDHRRPGHAVRRDHGSGAHRSHVIAGEHVAAAAHDARGLAAARRTGGVPVTTIA